MHYRRSMVCPEVWPGGGGNLGKRLQSLTDGKLLFEAAGRLWTLSGETFLSWGMGGSATWDDKHGQS